MALVTTIGGSTSDSYVTLAEADDYFDARFGSDVWTAPASDADKEKALKQAARHLGRFRFVGQRNSPTQALSFPRGYPYNDDPERQSAALAIPQTIKDAQCEEALSLLEAANDPDGSASSRRAALQAQGVTAFSIPGLTESYSANAYMPGQQPLCETARALISRWVSQQGRIEPERPTARGVVVNLAESDPY